MTNLILYKNQSFSEDEIEKLLKALNALIDEQNAIMEEVYQLDLFIKSTMALLIEAHPELFAEHNRLTGELKWLVGLIGGKINENTENDIDNPYITNNEPEAPKEIAPEERLSCRKLFQKICSLTHPDKIKHIKMTKYFITAKKLYHNADQKGLQSLLDLILSENIKSKNTNDDEYLILTSRIYIAKEDVTRAKITKDRLIFSEDHIISSKYKNNEIETSNLLFTNRINKSIDALKQQIIEFKSSYFGVL